MRSKDKEDKAVGNEAVDGKGMENSGIKNNGVENNGVGHQEKWFTAVQEMRKDNAKKQKEGLHFIITSVFIWLAIFVIHCTKMPILTKNLFTFCCSVPLMPLAFLVSKIIKVDFQNKGNPLTTLGIIFSVNQMLYILIAMWVYAAVPEKMVMVYAIIFGAHLLPYGWAYQSKVYYVFAILIPILVLAVGISNPPVVIAAMMLVFEIVFCILLAIEVRKRYNKRNS